MGAGLLAVGRAAGCARGRRPAREPSAERGLPGRPGRCVGRAALCARGRRPAREPSAPRASLGASSRSPARPRHRPRAPQPGLDVTHPHRSLALPPATAPPPGIPNVQLASESPVIRGYVERYTLSTDLSRHFPPLSVPRTLAAQPGPGRWQASSCPLENVAESCPWDPRPGPAAVVCPRADALAESDVGEWCRLPVRVCKKSAALAGLRTCVELRRSRNSLSGGRPSPGAWRRRAR